MTVAADERSLLLGLEALLEREALLLDARDADGLVAIAAERESLVDALAVAVRRRRAGVSRPEDTELVALYERLRRRHDVHAHLIRRHAARNACALGVLAQASGQTGLYRADGSVRREGVAA